MSKTFFRKLNRTEVLLVVLLLALLAVFGFFLASHFQHAKRSGVFEGRPPIRQIITRSGASSLPTKMLPEHIDAWMTFRYVNVVFAMPDSYLAERLAVPDSKYPNVPIGKYAKRHGLDIDAVIFEIRKAVSEFESSRSVQ